MKRIALVAGLLAVVIYVANALINDLSYDPFSAILLGVVTYFVVLAIETFIHELTKPRKNKD